MKSELNLQILQLLDIPNHLLSIPINYVHGLKIITILLVKRVKILIDLKTHNPLQPLTTDQLPLTNSSSSLILKAIRLILME